MMPSSCANRTTVSSVPSARRKFTPKTGCSASPSSVLTAATVAEADPALGSSSALTTDGSMPAAATRLVRPAWKIVPSKATPSVPPRLRKSCVDEVATPRWVHGTASWTTIMNAAVLGPNPRPRRAIEA